jgi:hypothetical protein
VKLFDIYINPDSVKMLDQTVHRPSYIGVSEWVEFWENVRYGKDKEKEDAS